MGLERQAATIWPSIALLKAAAAPRVAKYARTLDHGFALWKYVPGDTTTENSTGGLPTVLDPYGNGYGGAAGRWIRVLETPTWIKVTKTYSDLSAASTTNDVELFSLPAAGIVHMVRIKHSTAFAGGSISAYTVSVGITGNLAKYASAFDVFQAVADTTLQLSDGPFTEDAGSATSVRLAATSTSDNLDQATAGSVDVHALVSALT